MHYRNIICIIAIKDQKVEESEFNHTKLKKCCIVGKKTLNKEGELNMCKINSLHKEVGVLLTDIEGVIVNFDDNIEDIFNHSLLNDVNKILPNNSILNSVQEHKINRKIYGDLIYFEIPVHSHCAVIVIKISSFHNDVENQAENLDVLMQISGELVSIVDKDGIFLDVNQAYLDIMDMDKKELIGKSVFKLQDKGVFDYSSSAQVIQENKKVISTQTTSSGKRLIIQGIPIFNRENKLKKVINVAKNITEKEILKQKLKEAQSLSKQYFLELKNRINIKPLLKTKNMKNIYDLAYRVADVDATVLILGESGVGKGILAKDIHEYGSRNKEPFIQVNCGAIPESLIESELFGYSAGTFTGASKKGKKGMITAANNGTLFLDEIGELPLDLQVKLLQVIQEKKVTPLGQSAPIDVNVRFIAATNKNLKAMVEAGEFRKDLYYRLNVIPINIPPLRERKEEIPFFIRFFLNEMNNKYQQEKELDYQVMNLLTEFYWEGNIRELQNLIERLVVTSDQDSITVEQLPLEFTNKNNTVNISSEIMTLKEQLQLHEKEIIKNTLKSSRTMKEAGLKLGVDVSTISRKIKFHQISF